jgi:hypothetical protein
MGYCELTSRQVRNWMFTSKHRFNGTWERYKARLVAFCFSQQSRSDYNETLAPVAAMTSIHVVLSSNYVRPAIDKMDVKKCIPT